jgi:hypothetical protein
MKTYILEREQVIERLRAATFTLWRAGAQPSWMARGRSANLCAGQGIR